MCTTIGLSGGGENTPFGPPEYKDERTWLFSRLGWPESFIDILPICCAHSGHRVSGILFSGLLAKCSPTVFSFLLR